MGISMSGQKVVGGAINGKKVFDVYDYTGYQQCELNPIFDSGTPIIVHYDETTKLTSFFGWASFFWKSQSANFSDWIIRLPDGLQFTSLDSNLPIYANTSSIVNSSNGLSVGSNKRELIIDDPTGKIITYWHYGGIDFSNRGGLDHYDPAVGAWTTNTVAPIN